MMNQILLILRFLFCMIGAAALLGVFSFPDAVIPPSPAMESAEGFTLYALKPAAWLLPVLFMELVSCCGPRRNLVWFSSLFAVLVAALVAYPVLEATRPEITGPTFTYQGGMLSSGLAYYMVFTAVSFLFRKVLLAYAFPSEELHDNLEVGFVSASALDPSSARTVQEIAAEKKAAAPRFRFKQGDARMAERFRLIMKRMVFRSRMANAATAVLVAILILWLCCYPQPTAEEALQRDLKAMYAHKMLPNGYALASNRAVHAAARVMKHISDDESLAGMTRAEAEQWLGLDAVPPAYKAWLRDERPIALASANSMHENRTRFLTVTNGRQICVLYIRTSDADGRIIVSELQDAGWDAVADENRRRIGNDWGALYR